MNLQLLKDALSDATASAAASKEVTTVNAEAVRVAADYIEKADANVVATASAIGVKTITLEEYRAMRRKK